MPRGAISKRSSLNGVGPGGFPFSGTPTAGQFLVFNGTAWVPETPFDQWVELTADTTTAADAYSTILTINVTPTRVQTMRATALWSVTTAPTSNPSFAIFVDGAQRRASSETPSNVTTSGGHSWSESLTAAAHVVTLRWRNLGGLGGGIFIRPNGAGVNIESGSLRVQLLG